MVGEWEAGSRGAREPIARPTQAELSDGGTAPGAEVHDVHFYEALGRAIKVLRTERGLNRRELAEDSEVSYPYLSEIENGKKRPSSRALLAISEALGVRPHEVLESAERLADQARDAGWSFEDYLAAVLEREVSARNSSGFIPWSSPARMLASESRRCWTVSN